MRLYVDADYLIADDPDRSRTGVYGPFANPIMAEQAAAALAARPDVISAIIRNPDDADDG